MEIDLDKIRELVALVKEAQISELTVRIGDTRITIKKEFGLSAIGSAVAGERAAEAAAMNVSGTVRDQKRYVTVVSPVVGRFHLASSQDGKPLTAVGQSVEGGQAVCIVESLGHAHEVRSPESGVVVQVLSEDGALVEYGQELLLIECEQRLGAGKSVSENSLGTPALAFYAAREVRANEALGGDHNEPNRQSSRTDLSGAVGGHRHHWHFSGGPFLRSEPFP